MTIGLIGSTGFVGRTIARQRSIDVGYHRPDIEGIRGREFERLYIAGAPAQKWVANAEPEQDAAALAGLVDHLRSVTAATVVLISTVDVYPDPSAVDESTVVASADHPQAYGRNRLRFEGAVRSLFPRTLVVRLPGLFGDGLRKNLVYDLLHERDEFVHRDSRFQFYDMARLCDDIDVAKDAGLSLVNVATEPIAATDVAKHVFGRELTRTDGSPAQYDMQTRYAEAFGRASGERYLLDRKGVLERMQAFVESERPPA